MWGGLLGGAGEGAAPIVYGALGSPLSLGVRGREGLGGPLCELGDGVGLGAVKEAGGGGGGTGQAQGSPLSLGVVWSWRGATHRPGDAFCELWGSVGLGGAR